MDENKKILKIIDRAVVDTKYVLDDAKPSEGIYRTLLRWTFTYLAFSLFLFFLDKYFLTRILNEPINSQALNQFFMVKRLLIIIFFSLSFLSYLVSSLKIDMSLKERDFLKMFSIFIAVYSITRMLYPIFYYMNPALIYSINSTLAVDLVVNCIAVYTLYHYFENKNLLVIFGLNVMIVVLYYSLKSSVVEKIVSPKNIESLKLLMLELQTNGFILMISFALVLFTIKQMKDDIYE